MSDPSTIDTVQAEIVSFLLFHFVFLISYLPENYAKAKTEQKSRTIVILSIRLSPSLSYVEEISPTYPDDSSVSAAVKERTADATRARFSVKVPRNEISLPVYFARCPKRST
ncbi:hypothetical protein V1477_010148 [Vespula maculifrons]|uniref:Uncharacterized protein n=1 Tax=Vespula maculifrons TaxID=7453 RepID=A0ABD2CC46_VESMC